MKGNEIFHMDAIWFSIQQKAALTKCTYFSKTYILPGIISGFYIMWLLHLTSFCVHHIVLTNCRKNQELRVASSGITLTQNFVKINWFKRWKRCSLMPLSLLNKEKCAKSCSSFVSRAGRQNARNCPLRSSYLLSIAVLEFFALPSIRTQ